MHMSERQWRKAQAAERVQDGTWTVQEGAQALNISLRQMRRIVAKTAREGTQGIIHGNQGRQPSNRIDDLVRQQVLELARGKYMGFNDTHLFEKLTEIEAIRLGRETLRRILRGAGLGAARKRRAKRLFKRRPRRSQEGLLLLWDGSQHDWLEGRGPKMCLMAAVDDATGKILRGAHFVQQESSAGYLRTLLGIVKHHGVPWSMYMDQHGSLKRNDNHWTLEEELRGRQDLTQVGRALQELEIEAIYALTPQAKGRVERVWGTLQDRLVSELRLAKAHDMASAQAVLDKFCDQYNRRFGRRAADQTSGWRTRPANQEINRICAFSVDRLVKNDSTVVYEGCTIDLPAAPGGSTYAGKRVDIRHQMNDEVRVYFQDKLLATVSAPTPIKAPAQRKAKTASSKATVTEKKTLTFKQIVEKGRSSAVG